MVPKIIHYCWFGKKQIPSQNKDYMTSWSKHMPDYEIIEWNENNFDVHFNNFCSEAYEKSKWAFVSDVARLYIVLKYGGIYLDTDIELLKPLTTLVDSNNGFIGFQNPFEVTTGLGFAAAPDNACVKKMLEMYDNRHFSKMDGTIDMTPCPAVNTAALLQCGLKTGERYSKIIQTLNGMTVYPVDYFNPVNRNKMSCHITSNTYSIHHYSGSWVDNNSTFKKVAKRIIPNFILEKRDEYVSKRDIKHVYSQVD